MIKKLFVLLLISGLFAMMLSPFYLKRPSGEKVMTFEEAKTLDAALFQARYIVAFNRWVGMLDKKVDADIKNALILPEKIETVKMYRWQDEKGNWHYSDTQSSEYTSEQVTVDKNRQVIDLREQIEKKQITLPQ